MKKLNVYLFLSVLILTFMFVSCENHIAVESDNLNKNYEYPKISISQDDLQTASAKALLLQIKTMYDSIDLLAENGLDFTSQKTKGLKNDDIDFMDLIDYIPKSKALGEDEAFNEKLKNITENFTSSLNMLLPDFSDAVNAGLLNIDESKNAIIVSEDEYISLNSLDGIIAVEMMNNLANGKSQNEAIQIIQNDIEKVIENVGLQEDSEKGLYSDRVDRWKDGVIKYMYPDNSLDAKACKAIEDAMNDWTNQTGGLIRFVKKDANLWNNLCYFLGGEITRITNKSLNGGIIGNSTVGASAIGASRAGEIFGNIGGWTTVHFDTAMWSDYDYKRVPRHELGHLIGLEHEHQRPDRDKYIVVPKTNDSINFGIYRDIETATFYKLEWRCSLVKICFVKIKIWYPTIVRYGIDIDHTRMVGDFDFDSIMLYPDLTIKQPYDLLLHYDETQFNTELSPLDIEAVKKLYKKVQ